jgi:uncharacterized membrane protein YqjE
MVGNNHNSMGSLTQFGRLARVALRGIHNRVELLAVECQEERLRLTVMLLWASMLLFLGTIGGLLVAATIILLFPEAQRVYVSGALGVLCLLGAGRAWFALRAALKREPFVESIDQVKKDRVWLESL